MSQVIRIYRFLNILSIDVVAGAIVSALFFAKFFHAQIRVYGLIALGLTVWVIYTTDHLRDAKKITHVASTSRHRFHQRHFKSLAIMLCMVVVLDLVSVFFVRDQVIELGLVLAPVVGLYLFFQHYLRFLKEFFIALLYTGGVLLLAFSAGPINFSSLQYIIVLQFFLVAWINLVMFSWFDQSHDQQDKQNSFVTILGSEPTKVALYSLLVLNSALSLLGILLEGTNPPVVILAIMNVTLFLIFWFRGSLAKDDQYRLIGDAVFLFPAVCLI